MTASTFNKSTAISQHGNTIHEITDVGLLRVIMGLALCRPRWLVGQTQLCISKSLERNIQCRYGMDWYLELEDRDDRLTSCYDQEIAVHY